VDSSMVSWLALGGFLALPLLEGASSAARSGRSGGVDFSRRRLRGCSGMLNFVFGIRSLFLWHSRALLLPCKARLPSLTRTLL
jgi:hypothetical protein